MNTDHSSCDKAPKSDMTLGKKKDLRSYLLGFIAAFIACLCCSLPLIPLILGLSGASLFKEQLGQYHKYFEIAAVMVLIAACIFMWRRHRATKKALSSFLLQVAFTLAMYGTMSFAMQKFVTPLLWGSGANSTTHANH